MNGTIHKFHLGEQVDSAAAKESLLLAELAARCLYGEARTRLEAVFRFDGEARICEIDAASEVGQSIARIFAGFLAREFGERSFRVERTA